MKKIVGMAVMAVLYLAAWGSPRRDDFRFSPAPTWEALAEGSDREMIKAISADMASAVDEKFKKAAEAMINKDVSIDAGREFVEAYVTYMHYVEAVHAAIVAAGGDHH